MSALFQQIDLLTQNRMTERTKGSVSPQELLEAVNGSFENPQIWLREFQMTPWSELRLDQPMRSSVYAIAHEGKAQEGRAYAIKLTHESAILVEQGSCIFAPASSANTIASLGFSRCIGYSFRTNNGLFFAHITEHDETLFKLRERLLTLYGPGIEQAYLPQLQENQLDKVSTEAKADLHKLKEGLYRCKIGMTPYPWSDLPPTSDSKEYSSGIIITPNKTHIFPLIVQETDCNGQPIYELDLRKDVSSLT